jgi:hypothetical protein
MAKLKCTHPRLKTFEFATGEVIECCRDCKSFDAGRRKVLCGDVTGAGWLIRQKTLQAKEDERQEEICTRPTEKIFVATDANEEPVVMESSEEVEFGCASDEQEPEPTLYEEEFEELEERYETAHA